MTGYANHMCEAVKGKLIRYAEDSEHGKLRTRTRAVTVFASIVNEAWHEQLFGGIGHGLREHEVNAITRNASWAQHKFDRADYAQRSKRESNLAEPIAPSAPKPADHEIPHFMNFNGDQNADAYLAWCRLRAGLYVAKSHKDYRKLEPYGIGKHR